MHCKIYRTRNAGCSGRQLHHCNIRNLSRGHGRSFRLTRLTAASELQTVSWLAELNGDYDDRVGLGSSQHAGRFLRAQADIPGGQMLISVPLEATFQVVEGPEYPDNPWSIEMALDLLIMKYQQCEGWRGWESWLALLPSHEAAGLPISTFSDEELQACGDPAVVREAQSIGGMVASAVEGLQEELVQLGASSDDLRWAVNLAHSRSFVVGAAGDAVHHIIAPGIDFANHSAEPTAFVRTLYSPDACQGSDASADVCDSSSSGQTQIQLIAGESGIRAGQEVTISYGSHPNEVFFLLYGFVLDKNPHDTVALFTSQEELLRFVDPSRSLKGSTNQHGPLRLAAGASGWTTDALDAIEALLPTATEGGFQADRETHREDSSASRDAWLLLQKRCCNLLSKTEQNAQGPPGIAPQDRKSNNWLLSAKYRDIREQLLKHLTEVSSMALSC